MNYKYLLLDMLKGGQSKTEAPVDSVHRKGLLPLQTDILLCSCMAEGS